MPDMYYMPEFGMLMNYIKSVRKGEESRVNPILDFYPRQLGEGMTIK